MGKTILEQCRNYKARSCAELVMIVHGKIQWSWKSHKRPLASDVFKYPDWQSNPPSFIFHHTNLYFIIIHSNSIYTYIPMWFAIHHSPFNIHYRHPSQNFYIYHPWWPRLEEAAQRISAIGALRHPLCRRVAGGDTFNGCPGVFPNARFVYPKSSTNAWWEDHDVSDGWGIVSAPLPHAAEKNVSSKVETPVFPCRLRIGSCNSSPAGSRPFCNENSWAPWGVKWRNRSEMVTDDF